MASYVEVPAQALFGMLGECGFERAQVRRGSEVVFERRLLARGVATGAMVVRVYTSVREGSTSARRRGKDAIRVAAHWQGEPGMRGANLTATGEPTLGVFSERVFRAGTVEGVLERTRQRMREAWALCARIGVCPRCGGPAWPSGGCVAEGRGRCRAPQTGLRP